jgi:DNA-binding beta-propeller fold protein YncE
MKRVILITYMLIGFAITSARASGCPPPDRPIYSYTEIGQMAHSTDGRVFVADQGTRVAVLGEDGTFLAEFGTAGSGLGQFSQATGVAIAPSGDVYVADQVGHRITVFSPALVPRFSFGSWGLDPGQLQGPSNLAFSPDGQVLYVTEHFGDRVSMFSPDGTFLSSFGSSGTELGQFHLPFGIAVAPTGILYIGDFQNHRVQRFTSAGVPLDTWGEQGTGPGQFQYVSGIGLDEHGQLYVSDLWNHRVQVFGPDGAYVCDFGHFGQQLGDLYAPLAVMPIPSTAQIWVGNTYNFRIEIFVEKSVPAAKATWGSVKAKYR